MIHKIAHIAHIIIAQKALLHFYGCLALGLLLSLITVCACFGLVKTAHRRSRMSCLAVIISILGMGLFAFSIFLNAFTPLKPHHSSGLLIPTSNTGVFPFLVGLLFLLVGFYLMPKGEAGKWLDVKSQENEEVQSEVGVWPPAPKL